MPRPRNSVPTYRLHRQSAQAIVTVRDADDRPRDVLLGPYGSPESKAAYARIVAEARASPAASQASPVAPARDLTVNEVLLAFWEHAQQHYRRADGTATNELTEYRLALRPVRQLYGHARAAEFGPRALKSARAAMVDAGLSRPVVNRRVGRLKRVFKWAASEELIPVATFQALATVGGLQRGRTTAREPEPVLPVGEAVVDATLPHLMSVVAAMVRFQRLTGCRPQDVCGLRGDAIERAGAVWVFRPGQHKGAWRGKAREVRIGPRAQAVIAPFLDRPDGGYLFRPSDSRAEHLAGRRAARKAKLWPSHVTHQALKRASTPSRAPGGKYTTSAYGRSVARASAKAGVPAWHPNQLRHAFATEVRRRFGLEAAQVLLGHARADVTQVYAERDATLAAGVAGEIG